MARVKKISLKNWASKFEKTFTSEVHVRSGISDHARV